MHVDRWDVLALGTVAGGVALVVFFIIPRIEIAIALFDRIAGGL
jgi:hypothetical protein